MEQNNVVFAVPGVTWRPCRGQVSGLHVIEDRRRGKRPSEN